jgi:hypothetical protein
MLGVNINVYTVWVLYAVAVWFQFSPFVG